MKNRLDALMMLIRISFEGSFIHSKYTKILIKIYVKF